MSQEGLSLNMVINFRMVYSVFWINVFVTAN
jgi:hypothetical protein